MRRASTGFDGQGTHPMTAAQYTAFANTTMQQRLSTFIANGTKYGGNAPLIGAWGLAGALSIDVHHESVAPRCAAHVKHRANLASSAAPHHLGGRRGQEMSQGNTLTPGNQYREECQHRKRYCHRRNWLRAVYTDEHWHQLYCASTMLLYPPRHCLLCCCAGPPFNCGGEAAEYVTAQQVRPVCVQIFNVSGGRRPVQ